MIFKIHAMLGSNFITKITNLWINSTQMFLMPPLKCLLLPHHPILGLVLTEGVHVFTGFIAIRVKVQNSVQSRVGNGNCLAINDQRDQVWGEFVNLSGNDGSFAMSFSLKCIVKSAKIFYFICEINNFLEYGV